MKSLILVLLLSSCALDQLIFKGVVSNQGVIGAGDNIGNTMSMQVDVQQMDVAGDYVLTKEDAQRARSSYEKGLRDAQKETTFNGARINYVAFKTANLTVDEMLKKFPKMKGAHPDLQYYVTRLYNAHPYFVVGEVRRSKSRQRKLRAKGVSWTIILNIYVVHPTQSTLSQRGERGQTITILILFFICKDLGMG